MGRDVGLRFRSVGVLVVSQFCLHDRETGRGRMPGSCRELPKKPVETDVRRILIAHAMIDKSRVRNGHKILRGFAAGPTEGEGIFADRSFGFKPNILKYNLVTHGESAISRGNQNNKRGALMMTHLYV